MPPASRGMLSLPTPPTATGAPAASPARVCRSPRLLLLLLSLLASSLPPAADAAGGNTATATLTLSESFTLSRSHSVSASLSDTATESPTASESATLTLPTATDSATASVSLSATETATPTASLSLSATGSLSNTATLSVSATFTHTPSASASFSVSLSRTASVSLTASESATLTLPTATASATETFTLPTATATETLTLPTGTATETLSLTLPTSTATATESLTGTLTLPTGTATATETLTLPTGTATETFSLTLPTGTASATLTLSLPTASATFTPSLSLTETLSLPTATETHTLTFTLPTGTATLTLTLPTGTSTYTDTLSLPTATETHSLTESESLQGHTNYTMLMQPEEFVEGQELRLLFGPVLDTLEQKHLKFNTSLGDEVVLETAAFEYSATHGTECEAYVAANEPRLHDGDYFGVSLTSHRVGEAYVAAGYTTITAPRAGITWIVCFKHHLLPDTHWHVPDEFRNRWALFVTTTGALPRLQATREGDFLFSSPQGALYYHLPEASVGQYAIVQVLSGERWNLTCPPSACGRGDLPQCALGDSLKIVRRGAPCTVERLDFSLHKYYLGTRYVNADGTWQPPALRGLSEGATRGGVGAFGTQYANPLVDAWTAAADYGALNAGLGAGNGNDSRTAEPPGAWRNHAYAYVRLPLAAGEEFDVCHSAKEHRADIRLRNSTDVGNVPVWRKLLRCDDPATCGATAPTVFSFTTLNETVAWTMYDLTPQSWGDVVFYDEAAKLNTHPAQGAAGTDSADAAAPVATDGTLPVPNAYGRLDNYWAPQGGDYFRLVRLSGTAFREDEEGSLPTAGCWSRALDTPASLQAHGGYSDAGAVYPVGSTDLHGDPTTTASQRSDDAANATTAHATLFVPQAGTAWLVCYRRTCGSGGLSATCRRHAGMRVLPYFDPSAFGDDPSYAAPRRASAAPLLRKWAHLAAYHRDEGSFLGGSERWPADANPYPLVPGLHWLHGNASYPSDAVWHMNDTREGTWGPLLVEVPAHARPTHADGVLLDSRPWNYQTLGSAASLSAEAAGSTLRLVPSPAPCDAPGLAPAAASADGGLVECAGAEALNASVALCRGSSADDAAVESVAFYVTVPPRGAAYRVCLRTRAWNWVELQPAAAAAAGWLPSQPSGARERGEWRPPAGDAFLAPEAPPPLSVESVDDAAGTELLFVVRDAGGGGVSAAPLAPCLSADGGEPRCEARAGDVFRLVPASAAYARCDLNAANHVRGLTDTHVSVYCERHGSNGSLATTGLAAPGGPCGGLRGVRRGFCGGAESCGAATEAQRELLAAYTRRNAGLPVWDDVAPHDEAYRGGGAAAAAVVAPSGGAANQSYLVCYKQVGAANWAVFNHTMRLTPPPEYRVTHPPPNDADGGQEGRGAVLLGGTLQRFTLRFRHNVSDGAGAGVGGARTRSGAGGALDKQIRTFRAKLVRARPEEQNDGCVNEAGGTEASPFGAQTTRYVEGARADEVDFYVTVPQATGRYHLCVMLKEGYGAVQRHGWSWWRPNLRSFSYAVKDSGVRWYVTRGNRPTNSGQSTVSLVKCDTANVTAPCVWGMETYDTSPGGDSAKIVRANDSCSDGDAASGRSHWGASVHVGYERWGAGGTADLGPGNGPNDVAEFATTLPAVDGDARVTYKVCVRSSFAFVAVGGGGGGGGARSAVFSGSEGTNSFADAAWVEAPQARGLAAQAPVLNGHATRPAFHTVPAVLRSWELDEALRPLHSMLSGVQQDSVGLAGASVTHVVDATAAVLAAQVGFRFATYLVGADRIGAGNAFKLVMARRPASRLPSWGEAASWGNTSAWPRVQGEETGCGGQPYAAANNVDVCDAPDPATGACAGVAAGQQQVSASFHVPVDPGEYYVCYRVQSATLAEPSPWLWIHSQSGSRMLHAHPSFLGVESDLGLNNMTLFDLATGRLTTDPLSTWCGGVPCADLNAGLRSDLVSIVNDTQLCVPPASTPLGGDAWWPLTLIGNSTAKVLATAVPFVLPPAQPHPTGRYKICVYKAGDGRGFNTPYHMLRRGVVYQVYNLGLASSGGDTGYWRDHAAAADATQVAVSVVNVPHNTTARFIAYAADGAQNATYAAVPAAELTHPRTRQVSRTPLVRSGSSVRFAVSLAAADGSAVPFGAAHVEVGRCVVPGGTSAAALNNFAAAACATAVYPGATSLPDPSTYFAASGAAFGGDQGSCSAERGAKYGWPYGGLRQSLAAGRLWMDVTYLSACPDAFFGCGVRFRAWYRGAWVYSLPQWVNVLRNTPDGLLINGSAETAVGGAAPQNTTNLHVVHCVDGATCRAVLRPTYNGPVEHAPNGTLTLRYSLFDYNDTDGVVVPKAVDAAVVAARLLLAETAGTQWGQEGTFTYSFVPLLRASAGYFQDVFLEAVYADGDGGTRARRFAVRTERLVPAVVRPLLVQNLDVNLEAAAKENMRPAPPFLLDTAAATAGGAWGTELQAREGAHLEALKPYRLVFAVGCTVSGPDGGTRTTRLASASEDVLAPWRLRASVSSNNNDNNRVLSAVGDAATGVMGAANGADTPALSAALSKVVVRAAFAGNETGRDGLWVVDFRVLNNIGCSRFANLGKGCVLAFHLEHTGIPVANATSTVGGRVVRRLLTMRVVTPVRVVASTVRVLTEAATAPVRTGLRVVAVPGTPCAGLTAFSGGAAECFLPDEFHDGDLFALLVAPAPATGVENRDGVGLVALDAGDACAYAAPEGAGGCAVSAFAVRRVAVDGAAFPAVFRINDVIGGGGAGELWAATWRLRATRPCTLCRLTFHSTAGAGPDSFFDTRYGAATLSFTDEEVALECAVDRPVVWFAEGAAASSRFTVRVTARGVASGEAPVHAAWAVWTDTREATVVSPVGSSRGYTLQDPRDASPSAPGRTLYEKHMPGGGRRAEAVFESMFFTADGGVGAGLPAAGVPEVRRYVFRTEGDVYGGGGGRPGSLVRERRAYSCVAEVTLRRGVAPAAEAGASAGASVLSVESVSDATALCPSGGGGGGGCGRWVVRVADLVKGVSVVLRVSAASDGRGDGQLRNVTVVPRGGPGTTGGGQPLDFAAAAAGSADDAFSTAQVRLDSVYNGDAALAAENENLGGNARAWDTLTYGAVDVVFSKGRVARDGRLSDVGSNGEASVGVRYNTANASVLLSPVRQAEFDVCGSTSGGDGSVFVEAALCARVRLWVLPNEPVVPDVHFLSEEARVVHHTGSGSNATCADSPASALTFDVVSAYVAAGVPAATRFVTYDVSLDYVLSMRQQTFTPEGSDVLTVAEVVVPNGVEGATHEARLANTRSFAQMRKRVVLYGRSALGADASAREPMRLDAAPRHGAIKPEGAATNSTYSFVEAPSDAAFASWELSPTVTLDEECPLKRHLSSVLRGYHTYAAAPGRGWGYGTAQVGLPFPLQTVVRTPEGRRAWGFQSGVYVRVTKRSFAGCSSGGDVKVFRLRPTGPTVEGGVMLRGGLESFVAGEGEGANLVRTGGGAAVVWVALTDYCEQCTLLLELCYTTGTTEAGCMLPPAGADATPSDAGPLYAQRRRTTKPFSVAAPEANAVAVVAQGFDNAVLQNVSAADAAAAGGGTGAVAARLGETFSVTLEKFAVFPGGWAFAPRTALNANLSGGGGDSTAAAAAAAPHLLEIGSVWAATAADLRGTAPLRYGNGGFLQGGRGTLCAGTPAQLGVDAQQHASSVAAAWPYVEFFFTRPCAACTVFVRYQLRPSSPVHTLFLRRYARELVGDAEVSPSHVGAAATVFRAGACGVRWVLAGRPAAVVRRREPFSVTGLWVDANNFPEWAGGSPVTVALDAAASGGNGGGGLRLEGLTPPTSAQARAGLSALAQGGSATVVASFARACFRCRVLFADERQPLDVAVLTDPTRFVAAPRFSAAGAVQQRGVAAAAVPATWQFDVYLADEAGDRAYTVGGPALAPLRPLYSGHAVAPAGLTLVFPAERVYSALATPDLPVAQLTNGVPSARLSNGTRLLDGVPQGGFYGQGTPPGAVAVELSRQSAVRFAVSFALLDGSLAGLPTEGVGGAAAPEVDYTLPAARLAVEDPAANGCAGRTVGEACRFAAFAVALDPEEKTPGVYVLAAGPPGAAAAASHACAPASCVVGLQPAVAPFRGGVASFDLRFEYADAGVACRCDVTVSAGGAGGLGAAEATPQTFSVAFEAAASAPSAGWLWADHPTAPTVSPVQVDGLTAAVSAGADRLVGLVLQRGGGDGLTWADASVAFASDELSPRGCFVCKGYASVAKRCPVTLLSPSEVVLEGHFPAAGTCTFGPTAVSGLATSTFAGGTVVDAAAVVDTATAPLTRLTATVAAAAVVEVAQQTTLLPRGNAVSQPFSNLHGLAFPFSGSSWAAHPAAVLHERAPTLRFRVAAAAGGAASSGDYHTRVSLTPVRANADGSVPAAPDAADTTAWGGVGALACRSAGGVCEVALPVFRVTREAGCVRSACVHRPWYFAGFAETSVYNSSLAEERSVTVAEFRSIGPLYVVRRARRLVLEVLQPSDVWAELPEARGEGPPALPPLPPLRWMAGRPISLRISAVVDEGGVLDTAGAPGGDNATMGAAAPTVSVVAHPEDLGSTAHVALRARSVPCEAVDAAALRRDACTAGGGCAALFLRELPACAASDWALASDDVRLEAGRRVLASVLYTSRGKTGVVPLTLSTTQLSYHGAPVTLVFPLVVQRVTGLALLTDEGLVPPCGGEVGRRMYGVATHT